MNITGGGRLMIGVVVGIALGGTGVFLWLEKSDLLRPKPPSGAHAEDEHASKRHAAQVSGHGDAHQGEAHEQHRVVLSEKAIKEAGIETALAAGGELEEVLTLPAETVLNADKVAHIVPRVAGTVRRVDRFVGDDVKAGDVMAVLESRELAEAKAAYLASQQRLSLAQANLKSAEGLHAKKIMPDLEFLTIQKALAEAQIESRTAEMKLHALGVMHEECSRIASEDQDMALCELRAPFAGTVIQKHCSLGEVLNDQSDAFVLADLSNVWVNITVYRQDLSRIAVGQTVHLRADALKADGRISYLAPVLSEATRTATARVVIPNPGKAWKPGTFVTASIVVSKGAAKVLIPNEAIQTLENKPVVFVAEGDGFEPRAVAIGRSDATHSEIVSGVQAGERYVAKGAFILKAELAKGEGGHEH
jgi:cobalt-zinc-cadmium efflux system membrane fusion protein